MYLYRLVMIKIFSVQIFYNIYFSDIWFWFLKHDIMMLSVLVLLLLSFGSNFRMHQNRNTLTPYKEVRCSFKPAAKTLQPVSQDSNITVYTALVMTTLKRVFSCFYHPVISQHVGSLVHEKQGQELTNLIVYQTKRLESLSVFLKFLHSLMTCYCLSNVWLLTFCRSTQSFKANKTLFSIYCSWCFCPVIYVNTFLFLCLPRQILYIATKHLEWKMQNCYRVKHCSSRTLKALF